MPVFSFFAIPNDLWLNFGHNWSSENSMLFEVFLGTALAHAVARRSSPLLNLLLVVENVG
jgi:hypothetical protein